MKWTRCSTLILLLCVVTGCLQPVAPVPPATTSLDGIIKEALSVERQSNSSLASQVAITPNEADKKDLWLKGHDRIAADAGNKIADAIRKRLEAAKTAEEIGNVWREVAKGYANQ